MHELIITPFLTDYLVLRPGSPGALRLPAGRYRELSRLHAAGAACPAWLAEQVARHWQRDITGRPLGELAIIRHESPYGYVRATYELNLAATMTASTATSASNGSPG